MEYPIITISHNCAVQIWKWTLGIWYTRVAFQSRHLKRTCCYDFLTSNRKSCRAFRTPQILLPALTLCCILVDQCPKSHVSSKTRTEISAIGACIHGSQVSTNKDRSIQPKLDLQLTISIRLIWKRNRLSVPAPLPIDTSCARHNHHATRTLPNNISPSVHCSRVQQVFRTAQLTPLISPTWSSECAFGWNNCATATSMVAPSTSALQVILAHCPDRALGARSVVLSVWHKFLRASGR